MRVAPNERSLILLDQLTVSMHYLGLLVKDYRPASRVISMAFTHTRCITTIRQLVKELAAKADSGFMLRKTLRKGTGLLG